ncbi:MAG TPA: helix-turn-helix domain-containing protein [Dehalococcoidia bacterium]|nr:helix-turn-helix domain-containing protein [Dehalococcoidia bacterium]
MSITELRKDLEEIRASARAGDLSQVVEKVDHALGALDSSRLVTTTEAAHLLGIRSVNTLKLLVRQQGIPHELHGNRMMIPIAALERLQENAVVRGLRASDRAHDAIEQLGVPRGLTQKQMDDLSAARPGRVPWSIAE